MSSNEPTTYRVLDLEVRFSGKPANSDVKEIAETLSDGRYNVETIIEKIRSRRNVKLCERKENRVTTDSSDVGIEMIGDYRMKATYILDKWHNKAHETIECEKCGRKIQRMSYMSHKGSRPCKARAGRMKVEREGLSRVSVPTRREIIEEELGGEIESIATDHLKGNINRKGRLKKYNYADREKVEEAKSRYIPNPRRGTRCDIKEETSDYILVQDEEDHSHRVYEKTDRASDNTRKRVGYDKNGYLYSANGYRIGRETTKSTEMFTKNYLIEQAVDDADDLKA